MPSGRVTTAMTQRPEPHIRKGRQRAHFNQYSRTCIDCQFKKRLWYFRARIISNDESMDLERNCTVARLAEVFGQCQGEIIGEWRLRASELLQDLNLDKPTITDHLPDIIAEITRDLAMHRNGALSAEHTIGSPPVHGVQRFHDGLDVGEVTAEYNLLRVAFITVAERHNLYVVGEAARIINRRIDEAVRLAVMAFAAQQALMRKEQEDEHLAFIAHDLRTPLNAVSLLVEEVRLGLDDKTLTEMGDVFQVLGRNLQRLEDLIKRVLETSVQPSGLGSSFRPERRTFELWPLVQRLIRDLQSVASTHAVEVLNEIPRALVVYADAGLISQVFQNLLGNAFKYAAQGTVVIGASADETHVVCVVRDNGAGIPLDMLSNIFDKLATDPDKAGTGLGLAIVKQIVEAHGGQVSAESVHGLGATFRFTLPVEASC